MINVLKHWKYILLAIMIAWFIFTLVIVVQNLSLLSTLWLTDIGSFGEMMMLLAALYLSLGSNFTALSTFTTIGSSLLFGINVSLLLYYIRQVREGIPTTIEGGTTSIGGVLAAILGIGCAACGTFVATSLLSLFGATALLSLLPLGGQEFGLLAIGLLIYSVYKIYKKICGPKVCEIT